MLSSTRRLLIVAALAFTVLLSPSPHGLSVKGHRSLVALVFAGGLFALQPVPLPVAGLLVPVALVALGVSDLGLVFSSFSRPVIFLILGSLFLTEGLRKYGLTRRIALSLIVASGGRVSMILLSLMGIAALVSMWVENTATAAILIPVAIMMTTDIVNSKQANKILSLLVLGIAYGSSIGGMVTILGSASNAVAFGFLMDVQLFTFLNWMRVGLPAFLLVFPVTWCLLLRLVQVDVNALDLGKARNEIRKLGRPSSFEINILSVLSVTIFLWILGSHIESALYLPLGTLSPTSVAILAVAYLSLRGTIGWDDMKNVNWGFLFIIGAGLSLGETFMRTGATQWFVSLVAPVLLGIPVLLSLASLVFISAILTNVMNNATVVALLVPVVLTLPSSDPSFPALQFTLAVALATTFGYSLPSASGRMALIAASGLISERQMMKVGLITTIVSASVLTLFFYVLGIVGWI